MTYLQSHHRVAILLHRGIRDGSGKTGLTFLRYGKSPVVALIDQDCSGDTSRNWLTTPTEIPIVGSVSDALAYEPDVLLIGIAPSGGRLPDAWLEEVKLGVTAGLSVVNGLHTPMNPLFLDIPQQPEQWIWDVRQEPETLPIGKGRARNLSCQRVLTVGTDMIVGKMSAGLELWRCAQQAGYATEFLATGQSGMMITGSGVPLDAIRVDFAAGAIEQQTLELGQDCELLWVEGQGSLLHPGSTATLPLMRGSQPTDFILVHRAGLEAIHNCPEVKIPPLSEVVQLYEAVAAGAGAFAPAPVRGIALNTRVLDERAAKKAIAQVEDETGLPCTDVVRFGAEPLLAAVLAGKQQQ
ncbi:MAG: DUF1611 domain-containing protein [Spirulina sp. SIO3F2]|nr:DUF1611 domain-containing protein [Spirulina sp. SIO3F2]